MAQMDRRLPWFGALGAEERAWVGQIVQAGIRAFVDWFRADAGHAHEGGDPESTLSFAVASSVFGAAPRTLAGTITLHQTVELVRLTIQVVESDVDAVVDAADAAEVRAAVLRYGREIAFATAEVYARAAEVRGAWDARLEALVVDAVLRAETDETILSRASALGWAGRGNVAVILANLPRTGTDSHLFSAVRKVAREAGADALCAAQGDRIVVILGGIDDVRVAGRALLAVLPDGPVVIGPVTDDLGRAHLSARAATAAFRAVEGWPGAPRPVLSSELLPERALAGDGHARRFLVEEIFLPLDGVRGDLLGTLDAYFAQGASIEGTGRALFVHPNTVRYRLRQVADVTGLTPGDARDALTLQISLILGRQSGRHHST